VVLLKAQHLLRRADPLPLGKPFLAQIEQFAEIAGKRA